MTLKGTFLVLLGVVFFSGQDIPLSKVVGIYGKDGVEFVCLELYDNYRFEQELMVISNR